MLFIEYPKCSTCKKAKEWLINNNKEFIERNIIRETPTIFELKQWIILSGLDIKKFFNTSGRKYRELNLKDNLDKMNFDDKIKLLSSDAMLIKRPILVLNDKVLLGFKEKEWENIK